MSKNRFCVFCGARPENKNREHVLPRWLLKLTGDPKRVVNFGVHNKTKKVIRFDWDNFCVPACEKCNTEYSDLENRAQNYTKILLKRGGLTSVEYSDFMDWIDKVRVGLWIANLFLLGNLTNVKPHFHIKSRISQKDRMIAIYPLEGNSIGLNTFGAETLIFQSQPSCFGLRINDLFILNMSSDFLFADRCGFPSPQNCYIPLDGENPFLIHMNGVKIPEGIKHPLIQVNICKPSIHLYQPIMQKTNNLRFPSGYFGDFSHFDSYLASHTMPPYLTGKGKLFFQHLEAVEPILNINRPVEFEDISGTYSKPINELVRQVYEFQILILKMNTYKADNTELLTSRMKIDQLKIELNKREVAYFSNINSKKFD